MNAVAAPTIPREAVACKGSNHVPGCDHFPQPAAPMLVQEIACDLVDVGTNVRIDPGELEEMASSIAELGVLQPVKVVGPHADGRYRLVWGQRRLLASIKAGKATIPAWVVATADVDEPGARRSIEQLAENLQRADLNPIDEAKAIRDVLDGEEGLTQAELSKRLGRSPSWLANTLRLLGLDDEVQEHVRTGAVSASHAKSMVVLPAAEQRSLAKRIVDDKVSAHQIESELKWKLDAVKQEEAKKVKTAKWIPKAIEALEAADTPKDAALYVTGSYYDMDVEAARKAIVKAGWKKAGGEYLYDRPEGGKCDCVAFTLALGGRKIEIKPACSDDRHRDRARNLVQREDTERRKAIEARVAELRTRVRAQLEQVPVPILLLSHGDVWSLPALVEKVAGGDWPSELRDLIATTMADRLDASRVYNDRQKAVEKALEAVIEMLPPVETEAPAKATKRPPKPG